MNKSELLEEINKTWPELVALIEGTDESLLTGLKDQEGWSSKDHLLHLAAWERSALYMLLGQPRHEALGIEEDLYLNGTFEDMNDVIYQQTHALTLGEVKTQLFEVHAEMMQLIDTLTNAELQNPYRAYLPDEPGEGDGPPAIEIVYNDTAGHYLEHTGWIKTLIQQN